MMPSYLNYWASDPIKSIAFNYLVHFLVMEYRGLRPLPVTAISIAVFSCISDISFPYLSFKTLIFSFSLLHVRAAVEVSGVICHNSVKSSLELILLTGELYID